MNEKGEVFFPLCFLMVAVPPCVFVFLKPLRPRQFPVIDSRGGMFLPSNIIISRKMTKETIREERGQNLNQSIGMKPNTNT